MPPIPIHKNDPIVAAKPDGTTPQTATANPTPTRTTPASTPATTTSCSSDPPAPQPGARPAPPTGSAYSPAPSTPAAPQPGAVPSAPGGGAGYTATHHTTETRYSGPPSQFSIPPPSDTQLAGRSTTTSTEASNLGPTQLNMGPVASLYQPQHSQGAVQAERRSLENPPGYMQSPDNSPYVQGGNASGGQSGSEDAGVGGAAWNMLSKAGEALKKGEEAAWRAVRNK